jgi:Histidine kinase-, DNA gyrase B-, and HSP90-like ATPase
VRPRHPNRKAPGLEGKGSSSGSGPRRFRSRGDSGNVPLLGERWSITSGSFGTVTGKATIELLLEQDDQTATITVRDHGPGLPETGQDSLFDRFWRAEAGRERGKAGAGLGLAIAHEVVTAHRGQISAANASDGGAIFTVRLPKAPPQLREPQEQPEQSVADSI